jgi:hypothetical protein
MLDSYDLEKATIQKLAADVLCTKYTTEGTIEEKDAIEIDQTHHYMAQGNEVFTLVDMTEAEVKMSSKANDYFSKKAKMVPNIKAVGLVMNNLSSKIKQKFQMQLYKPLYPTKIFSNRQDALDWFEELRLEES